ncbi:MAG: hypothetical protein EBU70_05725 [Actinobacteria bacterium]|nr:hypothetical protein [Actinomycetota bacterium]
MESFVASIAVLSETTIGAIWRAALAALLGMVAVVLLGRRQPARPGGAGTHRVVLRDAPLERQPDARDRSNAATSLVAGGLVGGALVALVVTVVLAYLVNQVESLLG